MEKKINIKINDIILLAVSFCFLIGMKFVFGPCGPKEDGGFMACHWAGNAITGLAAVLTAISVIHIIVQNNQLKMGLALSTVPIAVFAFLIPNRVINLCMMHDMRCHTVMAPAVIVFSTLVIAAAAADLFMLYNRNKEPKEE
ncbi:MAG: DUF4418 family protein [Clostridia bacterium]|nr:DUF4418 family protein [Clostridia bacterium]